MRCTFHSCGVGLVGVSFPSGPIIRRFIYPVKAELKNHAVRVRRSHGHESAVRVRGPADNAEPKPEPRGVRRIARFRKPPEVFIVKLRPRVFDREEHVLIHRPD